MFLVCPSKGESSPNMSAKAHRRRAIKAHNHRLRARLLREQRQQENEEQM
jgi:hypothetical protein